ncbi:MAG: hypothetical protein CVT89_00165 [Candidatus Altiarchaeales archaeon HGW-Altiarchaeales-2]|nr:MAG: hypothetical protein CVT89_00165 [Candidatus Altiarchaeales archaeon HGW-Altiarchaeales-2]
MNIDIKKLKQNKEMWDIFTRKEEYNSKHLDYFEIHNLNMGKYVTKPIVSKFLIENDLKINYPENKKFAVCLTHDVDDIYPPLHHTLLSSLYCIKNLNFKQLKKQLFWKNSGKEYSPYRNFKEIIDLEEKYSAKSSFYFMATNKDIRRFRYHIEDLENDLGFIWDNDCEIGLHGGYYAYNNLGEIKKEKERIEKVLGKSVIGYRNHYLMFKIPDTWELLEKCGFKYDTTMGYNYGVGFRNGTCHPFKPFNLNSNKEIDILEIPMIIMDSALFNVSISIEQTWETVKNIINTVEKCNGVLTLSWHSEVFNWPFRENWKILYEKILKYCYEKNAWMTSGEEIYRWWNKNEESKN